MDGNAQKFKQRLPFSTVGYYTLISLFYHVSHFYYYIFLMLFIFTVLLYSHCFVSIVLLYFHCIVKHLVLLSTLYCKFCTKGAIEIV